MFFRAEGVPELAPTTPPEKQEQKFSETAENIYKPIDQVFETVGGFDDKVIDDPLSSVVNGFTKTINQFVSFVGPEPPLETDPTGITEFATESLGVLGQGLRSLNANIQKLIMLDPSVARGLIKLGEKGDEVCDASKGDTRMLIEFPGIAREFGLCIDSKTARNVGKQLLTDPIKPFVNALDCGFSESLLKPIDHFVRDVKNGVADVTRLRLKESFQNFVDAVQKVFAGTYRIHLSPDAITCFQAKTNDVPYYTTGVMELASDLLDLKWLGGERMARTPFTEPNQFARKAPRKTCDI